MTTLAERILAARNARGVSQAELGRRIGVKQQSIYALEAGKTKRSRYVLDIARVLGVDVNWLALGEGPDPEFSSDPGDSLPPEQTTAMQPRQATVAHIGNLDVRMAGDRLVLSDSEPASRRWAFPTEFLTGELGIEPSRLRMFQVPDDSMHSDRARATDLRLGDRVLVDVGEDAVGPTPPGVFVIHDGTGLTLRHLQYLPKARTGVVRAAANNSRYESYDAKPNDVTIIGRVVLRLQRY